MGHHGLKGENRERTLHLHIGIPKTASTWLQSNIFPKLDHLLYLDGSRKYLFEKIDNAPSNQQTFASIFKRSKRIWAGFGDSIFEDIIGGRDQWLKDGRDLLISDERIGRTGSRPSFLSAHLKEMKRKAYDWGFERMNILCVIRRQDHWLASHYAQMSDRNPKASQDDFERLIREITSPYLLQYSFGMLLNYNILYHELAEVSGKNNLLMLPYEELKASPSVFLNSLLVKMNTAPETIENICSETTGTMANVRSEQGVWQLRRKKRARVAGIPLPLWNINSDKNTIKIMPEHTQQIFKCYSAGNKELALKAGLDLEQYGYFGP